MSATPTYADWIAVDWGSSTARAWAIAADGTILAEAMRPIAPAVGRAMLTDLIGDWLGGTVPTPVLACGLCGGTDGAPYLSVPVRLAALCPQPAPTQSDCRLALALVPGLSQTQPPDLTAGEETRVAGLLARLPGFDGVVCLPGAQTRWLQISAEEIISFQTCMTGEIFGLLAGQASLRPVVEGTALDAAAFDAALADSLTDPRRLAQRLFAIRADAVLNGTANPVSRARLSGALIGAELAATRPYWLGQDVVVAGTPVLTELYARALSQQGVRARVIDGTRLALAGLARIRAAQIKAGGKP